VRYACADPSRVPPVVTDQADADAQAPGGRHWAGDRLRSSRRAVARELPPATRSGESRTTNVEYDLVAIHTGAETGDGQDSDPPPGFGTRLMLMGDLTVALRPDSPARILATFALGGFNDYADLYGRLEGQDLLARVGDRLTEAIDQPARFYRPRDTEFAAILDAPLTTVDEFLTTTASALTDRFAQFNLKLAYGAVMLPAEASEPIEALRLVDERLSLNDRARKRRERRATSRVQRGERPHER
jgi:GGDEF domain-containing protein